MKVFAYCTLPAQRAVAKATGVEPLTSPPLTIDSFNPARLEGYGLLYFRLHGFEGIEAWFGEGLQRDLSPQLRALAIKRWPALTRAHLEKVNLGGAVVIVANCYGSTSPMVRELYEAGASTVIAGPGPNMAAARIVVGTDKLARSIITAMRRGWQVVRALQWAKTQLLTTFWRLPDRDALEFKIMEA